MFPKALASIIDSARKRWDERGEAYPDHLQAAIYQMEGVSGLARDGESGESIPVITGDLARDIELATGDQGRLAERCELCNGDGWVAVPRWADGQKQKVRVFKVRCQCGCPLKDNEQGVISMEELDKNSESSNSVIN